MLSEKDKELLSYMLDEHDCAWVLALIESAYDTGYYEGYDKGWNDSYDDDHCIEDDKVD